MQYTLRNVPGYVDEALRRKAQREHKSLNQVVLEALEWSLGLADEQPRRRDLSDLAGRWVEDPETTRALDEQRRVDPDLWR